MKRISKFVKALLLLAAAVGVLLLFYHCPFRFFFGVACPGCGMTRTLFAAIFKDFETAFYYHPLVPFLIPVGLYIAMQMFCGMNVPPRRHNMYIILFAVAMFIVYFVRIANEDPVLAPDFSASLIGQISRILKNLAS